VTPSKARKPAKAKKAKTPAKPTKKQSAPARAAAKKGKKTPAKKAKKTPAKKAKKTPAKKAPAKKEKKPPAKKTSTKGTAETEAHAEPKKSSLLERKVPPRKPGSVICPLSGFEIMPQTANLSPKTIERLRRKLVDERERHVRQAEELQAEAEALAMERDPGDTQFDEESGEGDTVNVERERDLLLSASARQIVDAIDRALARMDAGAYGLCVPAGRRIALERLEAIPYAEECVDCKARAERRR
jgi:RNA polymerase-binding transcription factor DksA